MNLEPGEEHQSIKDSDKRVGEVHCGEQESQEKRKSKENRTPEKKYQKSEEDKKTEEKPQGDLLQRYSDLKILKAKL